MQILSVRGVSLRVLGASPREELLWPDILCTACLSGDQGEPGKELAEDQKTGLGQLYSVFFIHTGAREMQRMMLTMVMLRMMMMMLRNMISMTRVRPYCPPITAAQHPFRKRYMKQALQGAADNCSSHSEKSRPPGARTGTHMSHVMIIAAVNLWISNSRIAIASSLSRCNCASYNVNAARLHPLGLVARKK